MQDFCNFLKNKLSNKLSPRDSKREVNHNIKLVPGVEPENKHLYLLNQEELIVVKRQLTEFLTRDHVHFSKSSFEVLIFFTSKKNVQMQMCIDYRP